MAFCKNCGEQLEDGAKFCPKCGTATEEEVKTENAAPETENNNAGEEPKTEKNAFDKFTDTKDTTSEFDKKDIEDNKAMGILAYIWILVLIPIFAAGNSKFARFHANQGLILFLAETVIGIVFAILGLIPYVGILFNIIGWLVSLAGLALTIIGIVNAVDGKAKELPIIGKYKLLK